MHYNLEESIALKLSNALNSIRKSFNKEIKKYNISSEQYVVLKLINEKNLTPTQISQHLNKDKAAITRFINTLERKNFIKKENIDKRSYRLLITDAGKKILKEIDKKAVEFKNKINNHISKEKIECLFEVLEEIEKVIKD